MRTLIRISMLAVLLATVGSTVYVAASNTLSAASAAYDDCAKKRARGRKCDDDNRNGNSNGNSNSNKGRNSNLNGNSNGNNNSNTNSKNY